ncbi:Rho termination factor N-terminal domain-containing protein [Mycolicibacterium sp.]|uniref:Rho termination factor N-terminal domain-containing protein n=1 Tax=Mycolicibacterium sp. TaxID=2320850 RepID=UPI003D0A5974
MIRGEVPFRNNPTDRQKVISERYAKYIEEETGKTVDPEIIRAVRYTVLRHSERAIFDSPRELEVLTERTAVKRKRRNALALLKEAETCLERWLNDDLKSMILPELRDCARRLGVPNARSMRKSDLINAIRNAELDDAYDA